MAGAKPEENKHPIVKKKGHLHEDANENVENWRDVEIREVVSIRADIEIVKQIQAMARNLVLYDQITNQLRGQVVSSRVVACALYTGATAPEPNGIFPVENTSDTDNLLSCATCVKGQLQTRFSGH